MCSAKRDGLTNLKDHHSAICAVTVLENRDQRDAQVASGGIQDIHVPRLAADVAPEAGPRASGVTRTSMLRIFADAKPMSHRAPLVRANIVQEEGGGAASGLCLCHRARLDGAAPRRRMDGPIWRHCRLSPLFGVDGQSAPISGTFRSEPFLRVRRSPKVFDNSESLLSLTNDEEIASASGGLFGIGRVSSEERPLLAKIAADLTSRQTE